MKPETKELLLRLEPFAETHSQKIEKFITNLEKEKDRKLPQVFQKKLDTIKNSPLEEPKIAELQEEITQKLIDGEIDQTDATLDILEAVYDADEITADMNIKDVILMGEAVIDKVFGFKYEDENGDEVLKEVPSQMELQPLPYIKKRELRKILKKYDSKFKKALDKMPKDKKLEKDSAAEKLEEITKKLGDIKQEQQDEILALCNLDTTEMTEWEKNLLQHKLIGNQNGSYTPPVGKK